MHNLYLLSFVYFLTLAPLFAHPGIGIVINSQGTIFYTDLNHVWKLTQDGQHSIAVENVHTHELYIDAEDNLYGEHEWYRGEALDTWGNYVWRLNPQGVLQIVVPESDELLDDNTLVRDPRGRTYWSKRVGDHDELYRGESKWTSHKFDDIRWMHYAPSNDQLFVVDMVNLKAVSPDGDVDIVASNLKENRPPYAQVADHHYVYGVWSDHNQAVIVAVFGAQLVKRIDPNGDMTTLYRSEKGWSPSGGVAGLDGQHWILEYSSQNKARVTRIGTDGKATHYRNPK